MKKNKALTQIASLVILTSAVTGCARFENRTKAEGNYKYQDVSLITKYDTGTYSNVEQRNTFDIKPLTNEQLVNGVDGEKVDIRPPSQLMPVLDGVLLDPDLTQTKILFNAFKQEQDVQEKVWDTIIAYLASKNTNVVDANHSTFSIDTGTIVSERSFGTLSKNTIREEGRYKLKLTSGADKRSVLLTVDVQNFEEDNDGDTLKPLLNGPSKRNIEIGFVNDLLAFGYTKQESEAQIASDSKPLPIKLGFDDVHQTAWIVDADFNEVWNKLPSLLQLMSFSAVEDDKNLGYFLVSFEQQDAEYWKERNLNPIYLPEGEYFVQLGELAGEDTSITWLDSDKKPLSAQQVAELYLSITDNIRSVILSKDIQTKPL
jgi:outer membrane protein assembly factor BamC